MMGFYSKLARLTLSQILSFEILHTTFLKYMKIADLLMSRLDLNSVILCKVGIIWVKKYYKLLNLG